MLDTTKFNCRLFLMKLKLVCKQNQFKSQQNLIEFCILVDLSFVLEIYSGQGGRALKRWLAAREK